MAEVTPVADVVVEHVPEDADNVIAEAEGVNLEDAANCAQSYLLDYLTPLMRLGVERPLELTDITPTSRTDRCARNHAAFTREWARERARPGGVRKSSVLNAQFRTAGCGNLAVAMLLFTLRIAFGFAPVLIMRQLVRHFEGTEPLARARQWSCVVMLLVLPIVAVLCELKSGVIMTHAATAMRASVSVELFDKVVVIRWWWRVSDAAVRPYSRALPVAPSPQPHRDPRSRLERGPAVQGDVEDTLDHQTRITERAERSHQPKSSSFSSAGTQALAVVAREHEHGRDRQPLLDRRAPGRPAHSAAHLFRARAASARRVPHAPLPRGARRVCRSLARSFGSRFAGRRGGQRSLGDASSVTTADDENATLPPAACK